MNMKKRFILSLNLTVVICVLIISVVALINRIDREKNEAEDKLFYELEYLVTILDITRDRELDEVKDVFYNKSFYNTGYVSMIDQDGNVVICKHNEGANVSGEQFFGDIEIMREGSSRYYDETIGQHKWQYFTWYSPEQSYIVATIDQYEFITKPVMNVILILVFAIVFSVIVFGIIIYFITNTISNPLKKLANIVGQLGKGVLPKKFDYNYEDEVGQLTRSVNNLIDGLKKTALFAKEIENNNFDYEYTPFSEDDMLGNALLDMRQSLKKAAEEEDLRKAESEKRNWATQGIARFGDILRQNYSDINELSYNVIKNLVEYLGANQGGLFIINDNKEKERYLELTACYAYDRRKYLEKHIKIGEGLVGNCFIEKQTIHLTEIPENYIHITSGLGQESPAALIIVPLKLNEDIYGVIELASFNKFEDHKIEFVEKVGESIASTISSMKINQRTAKLLEKSQKQAEEMRAQEEEMRQNMEELHATQESMAEKERENRKIIDELKAELEKKEINELTEKLNKQNKDVEGVEKNATEPGEKPEKGEKYGPEEKPGEKPEEKPEENKEDPSKDAAKDIHDESKTESQSEWSEHLKESFKQFKKGRKK